jgi:hypothetical protein
VDCPGGELHKQQMVDYVENLPKLYQQMMDQDQYLLRWLEQQIKALLHSTGDPAVLACIKYPHVESSPRFQQCVHVHKSPPKPVEPALDSSNSSNVTSRDNRSDNATQPEFSPVKAVEEVEEPEDPSHELQFTDLLNSYHKTEELALDPESDRNITSKDIDIQWEQLNIFIAEHPIFKSRLPVKPSCSDWAYPVREILYSYSYTL